jgi:hypothetical protein
MCPTGVLQAHYKYSLDSIHWITSPRETYTYTVHYADGTEDTFARVERPQLHFAQHNSSTGTYNNPTTLYNGVCVGLKCLSMAPNSILGYTHTTARVLQTQAFPNQQLKPTPTE